MTDEPRKPAAVWQFLRMYGERIAIGAVLAVVVCVVVSTSANYLREYRIAREIKKGGRGMVYFEYRGPTWLPTSTQESLFFLDRVWAVSTGSTCTDDDLEQLTGLRSLEKLGLDVQITDDGLRHLQGLTTLKALSLSRREITGKGLKYLHRLQNLQVLEVGETQLDDAGLEQLPELKRLKVLNLRRTQVTDSGLQRLQRLPSLETLDLSNTRITGAGLRHLQKLSNLQTLILGDSEYRGLQKSVQITDEDLAHLRDFPKLVVLDLSNILITGMGLKQLQGLKKLQRLVFDMSKINDDDLQYLSELTELEYLNLVGGGGQITDAGLQHLKGLHRLRYLNLAGTGTTAAGCQSLQQALPDCKIIEPRRLGSAGDYDHEQMRRDNSEHMTPVP